MKDAKADRDRQEGSDMITLGLVLIGAMAIAFLVILLVRVQRGLLGLVIGGLAVALLAYWLMELRKTFRHTRPPLPSPLDRWSCDVIEVGEEITVIAEVPGPEEQVKVSIIDRTLRIIGGKRFSRTVELPMRASIVSKSYINGILNVKLRKK